MALSKEDNEEIMGKLTRTIKQIAIREARQEIISLLCDTVKVLRYNPHNTFKGTAREYILKYHLAREAKQEVFERFNVPNTI